MSSSCHLQLVAAEWSQKLRSQFERPGIQETKITRGGEARVSNSGIV